MPINPDDRGKHPISPLAGTYGHPIHPIVVTVPIGAWVSSLVFDIVSRMQAKSDVFATASMWLIGIGIIGALVAAAFGLMDLVGIPKGTLAFRTGLIHAGLNVTVVGVYIVSFVLRLSMRAAGPVPGGLIALSVAALGVLVVSGFLGGTLAYRYGVRVADEGKQAEGFVRHERGARRGLRAPREA